VTPDASGERLRVAGRVFDGDGAPVPDAMLETGRPTRRAALPIRRTSGRCLTPRSEVWPLRHRRQRRLCLDTISPVRSGSRCQAAGAAYPLAIFARGMLAASLYADLFRRRGGQLAYPVRALVPADRRGTCIARREAGDGAAAIYRFDIRLQGDGETCSSTL